MKGINLIHIMIVKTWGRFGRRYGGWSPTLLLLGGMAAGSGVAEENRGASVEQVLARYQPKVESRLRPRFHFAGARWPPRAVTLLALKDSRKMELWAQSGGSWKHIRDYRIKGMSGRLGPKLEEGDQQVPEGRYKVENLNPNSAFHLSIKLDYPNGFDQAMAAHDGRRNLGGDIFIHGNDVSRGCLAIGNNSIEELFVLTSLVGREQVDVLISSRDFRLRPPGPTAYGLPEWVPQLNREIARELEKFPLEKP